LHSKGLTDRWLQYSDTVCPASRRRCCFSYCIYLQLSLLLYADFT